MSLIRVYAIVLRQLYLIQGSAARVIPLFAWVAIDMILWGFLSRYLMTMAPPGFNFIGTLLGAILLWDFFIRIMLGVTMTFFEDVWSRNFLNIFASPLLVSEYVGGLVISSVLTSIIGVVVMLLIAVLFFHLPLTIYGLLAVPFVLVLFLFGISFGIIACAFVLRHGPAAEWFIWPIPALLSPFAGVLYPVSTLPEWMQWVSLILPPSYVFEALRTIIAGGVPSGAHLVLSIILAVGYVFFAYWYFNHTYKKALRTGLIARYSAETLG